MSITPPSLWIFAGPNGAGKSTLVQRYKVNRRILMINPDEIAVTLKPEQGIDTAILVAKAGRIAIAQRARMLANRQSFGIETTLTGRGELQLMRIAKDSGYKISFIYIGLLNANQSNSRVITRVRRGGHDVSEQDIYRRFTRSLANLATAIQLSDRVRVLDNSGERRRLILKIDKGCVRTVSLTMPDWAKQAIPQQFRTLSCSPAHP